MNRITLVFLLIFFCSVVSEQPPNIIIIVADDLGWNDVQFHGSQQVPTPNLDALGRAGVHLNNYYVSPICTPSRGALMSGRHPIHLGLQHNVIYAGEPWGLPLNITILPQHLKRLGYATHAVGKWHLGFYKKEATPTMRGFDSHYGYWSAHEDYYDHTAQSSVGWGTDFHNGLKTIRNTAGKYLTDLLTQRAVEIIYKHNSSQPLFLYVAHIAVHIANSYDLFQAPPNYVNRFPHIKDVRRRIFAGMISALDDSIGKIFTALNETSMLESSVIVFTTDNGGAAGGVDHSVGSNWPLRGSKYTLWEGGVKANAIFWTSILNKSHYNSYNYLMHISDWLPTLYSAAGGKVSDLGSIYGHNMWKSLLLNLPSPREEILHNIDPFWKNAALRRGDYKVVIGTVFNGKYDGWYPTIGNEKRDSTFPNTSPVEKILKSKGWKLDKENIYIITCKQPPPINKTHECIDIHSPCLFNIADDPCEYNNLAKSNPKILKDLIERVAAWNKTAVPPGKVPPDPAANPVFHQYAWEPWQD
ncbi:arylsulfatase B-like isoform X1 [Centruroides sculpturatus]|uniref:arylsulfatase B-like isoform X1 n=1 Tax=Centruroides sculpturatus TaxID=218467 RepID=UPI000C6E3ED0|nr:arylsulfatase B-like isoform X1 [Centruroides sculpturatus]